MVKDGKVGRATIGRDDKSGLRGIDSVGEGQALSLLLQVAAARVVATGMR